MLMVHVRFEMWINLIVAQCSISIPEVIELLKIEDCFQP